jgi:hypothetical protein
MHACQETFELIFVGTCMYALQRLSTTMFTSCCRFMQACEETFDVRMASKSMRNGVDVLTLDDESRGRATRLHNSWLSLPDEDQAPGAAEAAAAAAAAAGAAAAVGDGERCTPMNAMNVWCDAQFLFVDTFRRDVIINDDLLTMRSALLEAYFGPIRFGLISFGPTAALRSDDVVIDMLANARYCRTHFFDSDPDHVPPGDELHTLPQGSIAAVLYGCVRRTPPINELVASADDYRGPFSLIYEAENPGAVWSFLTPSAVILLEQPNAPAMPMGDGVFVGVEERAEGTTRIQKADRHAALTTGRRLVVVVVVQLISAATRSVVTPSLAPPTFSAAPSLPPSTAQSLAVRATTPRLLLTTSSSSASLST